MSDDDNFSFDEGESVAAGSLHQRPFEIDRDDVLNSNPLLQHNTRG